MSAQFVADGEWKHDPTGSIDTDHEGNVNNVIYPEDLQPTMSSVPQISYGGPSSKLMLQTEKISKQLTCS